ncbi:hypothetical protein [Terriglobus saanensis]|uniref:hypothetical protein n=1 Tax=Terriglobus saanensis TaxID=870903 RepID=UPI0003015CEA|nr:hypothetical protein [Terriglobus saanensis]
MSPVRFGRVLLAVVRQLLLPTTTVMSVLGIAFLMNYCGATATLSLAICKWSPQVVLASLRF